MAVGHLPLFNSNGVLDVGYSLGKTPIIIEWHIGEHSTPSLPDHCGIGRRDVYRSDSGIRTSGAGKERHCV